MSCSALPLQSNVNQEPVSHQTVAWGQEGGIGDQFLLGSTFLPASLYTTFLWMSVQLSLSLRFPGKSKWWPLLGTPLSRGLLSWSISSAIEKENQTFVHAQLGHSKGEGPLEDTLVPRADDGLMGILQSDAVK